MALKAYAVFSSTASQPLLVILHGFSGDSSVFTLATKERFAAYGVFTLFVEMRGRATSGGDEDCSGREIHDIYDAITYVKSRFVDYIDPDQVHLVGYSGGGGNALAAAAKFPDAFNSITSFFGISDYGHDAEDGWYNNGASVEQKALMDTWIGDAPATVPDAYHARAHVLGATNYSGGHLWLFHDAEDSTVPSVNSQNVADVMLAAGLSNYTLDITDAEDDPRWLHGYPNTGEAEGAIAAEDTFIPPIITKTYAAWTIPASGTVTVLGYIVTKRFSIWLGGLTEAAAGAGLDEAATVAYNTATGQYTVTPLTGEMDVFIKQDELTASQHITEETILTVA